MNTTPKTVVLAFSGGLDTTYTAKYLSKERGLKVITVVANTGGFSESELKNIETNAHLAGSSEHVVLNLQADYYHECIRYMIFGNMLKNNTYPLSVSSERFIQAKAIAEYASNVKADYLAHGCTAAGNDQVRFDMAFRLLAPGIEIISLTRDEGLSRKQEMDYLKNNQISLAFEKMEYSINQGLWGTSIGGKETLTSQLPLPEKAYPSKCEMTEPSSLTIGFENGEPLSLNNKEMSAVEIIRTLNTYGGYYAIGRGIHTGDTIIGTKGRVGFEAPAALMLIAAHQELEKHTLTKHQMMWKSQLSDWYANMLHDGMYLEPTLRNIEKFLLDSQSRVSGTVHLHLQPYNFYPTGVQSEFDLMNSRFGAYGESAGKWSADEVKGFIKIVGNPLENYYSLERQNV